MQINSTLLGEACEFFEISLPVTIRRSSGRQTVGPHRFKNGRHAITISMARGVEKATKTLMHELTHAAQVERFPAAADFQAEYKRENRRQGYARNRFEVEANAAKDFADSFLGII